MAAETRGSVFKTRTGVRHPLARGRQAPAEDPVSDEDRGAALVRRQRRAAAAHGRAVDRDHLRRLLRPVPRAARRDRRRRTKATLEERLAPAREQFGDWTLRELEDAAGDVAAWRAALSDTSRYRLTSALRQALGAAVRWRYIAATRPSTPAATRSRARRSCSRSRRRAGRRARRSSSARSTGRSSSFAAETGPASRGVGRARASRRRPRRSCGRGAAPVRRRRARRRTRRRTARGGACR